MKRRLAVAALLLAGLAAPAEADREPLLKQVDLPHSYYWRELYLPQLTTGPSSVSFMPDGKSLIYSMAGSLWRQRIGSDDAVELTHPRAAYDYQPDVAADGKSLVFDRYDGNAIELWRLDLVTGREQQLTSAHAVNVEPRLSPDGKRIAWVSTQGTGHFNLFIAEVGASGLVNAHALLGERQSRISRYYYSPFDHAINPSWSPDGKRIDYVTNNEVAWGTGDIWSVAADNPRDRRKILSEETSWSARPEISPDGKLVLFASYHGRQWRQLWVTTPTGEAPLPITFGEFDRWNARWSPDGKRIAFISNEHGNTSLVVHDYWGGAESPIVANRRQYLGPRAELRIDIRDEQGRSVPARVAVLGSDGRAAAPDGAWMRGDDGFDRALQTSETHYFDCMSSCTLNVPPGRSSIWVQRGFRYLPWRQSVTLAAGSNATVPVKLELNDLPSSFGQFVSADLHVHMNYGGHYRNDPQNLARQARAEDLNVIYNLIVNKEERVPDIAYFKPGPDPASGDGVQIFHSQEYHTSYWGHLGLLGLSDHVLTPGFAAYQNSPLASAYPDNGAIADLAHAQGALVGYVHPFDTDVDPPKEKSLSNELPADVAQGKVDYMEIVGFSDHKATAHVWYRLLNLGYRIPTGAGTDAMADYADLRGPVGMNRVFIDTGGDTSEKALLSALKAGRTFASNGPLLGLEVDGKHPGEVISRGGPAKLHYRVALRSPVAVRHLEIVENGRIAKAFDLGGNGRKFDAEGDLDAGSSAWLVLRAWNEGADPEVLDIYPYATTSPIYVEMPGGLPADREDAAYFVTWLDRVIADSSARTDYSQCRGADGNPQLSPGCAGSFRPTRKGKIAGIRNRLSLRKTGGLPSKAHTDFENDAMMGAASQFERCAAMTQNLLYPGIYVEEEPATTHPIGGVPTSIAAFVGYTDRGPPNEPVRVLGSADYQRIFGPLDPSSDMSYALADFFRNGGTEAWVVSAGAYSQSSSPDDLIGSDEQKTGIYSLDTVDLFNILLIPNQSDAVIHRAMIAFAERRRAFTLLDLPPEARTAIDAAAWISGNRELKHSNAAAYFPRLLAADEAQGGLIRSFANSGAIAGIFARTDRERGIWAAPVGTAAQIEGAVGLDSELSEAEQEELDAAGLNSLRSFPSAGMLVWGSRTLAGADASASDWKYIPVRRTALFIEESLYQGLQWAVFEPNGERTWAKIRLCVEGFLQSLFREGAFQGSTPRDAYFVTCDGGTTTMADIEAGRLNVEIGFAPLRPAEFVLLRIALPNVC